MYFYDYYTSFFYVNPEFKTATYYTTILYFNYIKQQNLYLAISWNWSPNLHHVVVQTCEALIANNYVVSLGNV